MSSPLDEVSDSDRHQGHITLTPLLHTYEYQKPRKGMDSLIDDNDWKCLDIGAWVGEVGIRLILCVIFGLSALSIKPYLRYVEVHDWPTYNFPHAEPETIEPEAVFVTICVVPLVLVILCSLIRPGWLLKYSYNGDKAKQSARIKRRVCTEFLIGLMAASLAYLANGVITDVIKNAYGRPRPDFLSRCFTPTAIGEDGHLNPDRDRTFTQANGKNLWLTLPSREYPEGNSAAQLEAIRRFGANGTEEGEIPFPFIEDVKSIVLIEDCINKNGGEKLLLNGGRRSFPSGHTSFSFAGATFCALYSYYWLGKLKSTMNLGTNFINFPGTSVKLGMFFLWYTPAIYVAITRTQDYRHHPGDVFAGAAIGILTTLITFLHYYDIRNSALRSKNRKRTKSNSDVIQPTAMTNHNYGESNNL